MNILNPHNNTNIQNLNEFESLTLEMKDLDLELGHLRLIWDLENIDRDPLAKQSKILYHCLTSVSLLWKILQIFSWCFLLIFPCLKVQLWLRWLCCFAATGQSFWLWPSVTCLVAPLPSTWRIPTSAVTGRGQSPCNIISLNVFYPLLSTHAKSRPTFERSTCSPIRIE